MKKKLWGGRFKKKTDARFEEFSASLKWDRRLLSYDLKIDAAHVKALKRCGVLSATEEKKFLNALSALEKKFAAGSFKLRESFEDVHSAVQSELSGLLGGLADKLHTARSRNDLVSQSSRLYCKAESEHLISLISGLQSAILKKAGEYQNVLTAGMTHLQNAQVLSYAHILLSYAEILERAKKAFELAHELSDVCVLGSGALAGVTFDLDQTLLAKELGLSRITHNSYDVSGDRDFVLSFLSAAVFLGTGLSRIAEDLMLGQTKPFSTIDIDQAFCTGSSMMPQKKNADFVELARGSAGIFLANFTGLAATLKGLPTSYNRDLQWDKKYLFDSAETVGELLVIFTKVFQTIKVNSERASAALSDESLYATDLADMLVGHGVAFKQAHEQAGQIVAFAEERNLPISKIGLDILKHFAPALDAGVYSLFDPSNSIRIKKTKGSTNPTAIKNELAAWKKRLLKGSV